MKPLLFLIASVALADPIAVTWSGSPTAVSSDCPSCPYGLYPPDQNAYQIGADAQQSITVNAGSYDADPGFSVILETPFTLASPAEVALSVIASYEAYGTSCGDWDCDPNLNQWALDGGFQGSATITEQDQSQSQSILTVNFGAAGSQAGQCEVGLECSAGYMSPGLSVGDSENGEIFLQAGTYDLFTTLLTWNDSSGDSGAQGNIVETLSDPQIESVPEPSTFGAVMAALIATLALLYVHKKLGSK